MPPDQLLRQTFELCADFAAARRMLETTPVSRPVIYVLVGPAWTSAAGALAIMAPAGFLRAVGGTGETLFDAVGVETLRRTIALPAGGTTVLEAFADRPRARSASLRFATAPGERLRIADLRLEGQSAVLRDYVRRALRFPSR